MKSGSLPNGPTFTTTPAEWVDFQREVNIARDSDKCITFGWAAQVGETKHRKCYMLSGGPHLIITSQVRLRE